MPVPAVARCARSNDNHYLVLRLGRHQETLRSSLPVRRSSAALRRVRLRDGHCRRDGPGGRAASRLAVATFAHQAVHFGKWHVRIDAPIADDVMDRATRFFKNVDAALLDAANGSPSGLQTTLSAVLTAGNELFFANVGNWSVYMFRDGALMPLTRHYMLGRRGPDQVETDALGAPRLIRPKADVERCGLLNGDMVLLCTKSLTEAVPEPLIAETLRLHRTPTTNAARWWISPPLGERR